MRSANIGVLIFAISMVVILIFSIFPPLLRPQHDFIDIFPAKRVLILSTIVSGYVTINEGTEHILAVSEMAKKWVMAGVIPHIYSSIKCIPLTNTDVSPDPEHILYLKPDAVLAYTGQANDLKTTGLPRMVAITFDPLNPIQNFEKNWRNIGEVSGKSVRVKALLDRYAVKVAELQRPIPLRRKRVIFLDIYNGKWWLVNSDYYIAYTLELAGAQNVSKGLKFTSEADLEQLLLLDPDIVVFAASPGAHTTMRQIAERPEFQSLRAVREHRIYRFPEHTFMNEPVEDPLLIEWMAEVFYPDIMPRRLREEYKETYWDVYHYHISDDEIDKAIFLDENCRSAGYERFVR